MIRNSVFYDHLYDFDGQKCIFHYFHLMEICYSWMIWSADLLRNRKIPMPVNLIPLSFLLSLLFSLCSIWAQETYSIMVEKGIVSHLNTVRQVLAGLRTSPPLALKGVLASIQVSMVPDHQLIIGAPEMTAFPARHEQEVRRVNPGFSLPNHTATNRAHGVTTPTEWWLHLKAPSEKWYRGPHRLHMPLNLCFCCPTLPPWPKPGWGWYRILSQNRTAPSWLHSFKIYQEYFSYMERTSLTFYLAFSTSCG